MARERVHCPAVVERAARIATGYQPLKCTLRQLHYRCAAEFLIPNTAPMGLACPPTAPGPAARAGPRS